MVSKKKGGLCAEEDSVHIVTGRARLEGKLTIPDASRGFVIFPAAGGSIRCHYQNHYIARELQKEKMGTLLVNLLTIEEEVLDLNGRSMRFNIELLARRLMNVTFWLRENTVARCAGVHYVGSGTASAASLVAAARAETMVDSVVSFAGRPDLAEPSLARIKVPLLFIVGGKDFTLLDIHYDALPRIKARKSFRVIDTAKRTLTKARELKEISRLSSRWLLNQTQRSLIGDALEEQVPAEDGALALEPLELARS